MSQRRRSSSRVQAAAEQKDQRNEDIVEVPGNAPAIPFVLDGRARIDLINRFQREVNEARKSTSLGVKNFPAYDKKNYSTPLGFLNEYETFMRNQVADPRIWSLILPDFIAPALQSPGAQSIRSSLNIEELALLTDWDAIKLVWTKTRDEFLGQFSTYQDRLRSIDELWGWRQSSGESVPDFGNRWIYRWTQLRLDPQLPSHKLFFVVSLLPILRERLFRDQELKVFSIEQSSLADIISRANSYSSDEPSLIASFRSGQKRPRPGTQDLGLHCDNCPNLRNHTTENCLRKGPKKPRFQSPGSNAPASTAPSAGQPAPQSSNPGTRPPGPYGYNGKPKKKLVPTDHEFVCPKCKKHAPGHYPSQCQN